MKGSSGLDWDKLRSFHASAETGSLTLAAERLELSQSAVSRHIAALEATVGVLLFHRHARGLAMTAAGQILHRATSDMAAAAAFADSAVNDAHDRPQGELKVTAPVAFGTLWLVPRLPAFVAAFPEVRLNLILDDRSLNLARFEAEAAIRLWTSSEPDVVQRKLRVVREQLYGSESYFARKAAPQTLDELDQHDVLAIGSGETHSQRDMALRDSNWVTRLGRDDRPPRKPFLTVNHSQAMLKAIEAGLGIGALPPYMLDNPGQAGSPLRMILSEHQGPATDIYFIYPAELRRSKRIEAFRTFLLGQVQAWTG